MTDAQKIMRAQGLCGELLNDGKDVCVLEAGHGSHDEDDWDCLGDYPPLPRNYEQCDKCNKVRDLCHRCDLTLVEKVLVAIDALELLQQEPATNMVSYSPQQLRNIVKMWGSEA